MLVLYGPFTYHPSVAAPFDFGANPSVIHYVLLLTLEPIIYRMVGHEVPLMFDY
jgi:hypothetical protein